MDPLHRLRSALADRYAIQREIGRGGMAIVFLAHDLRHSREVAIKVLRPEFAMAVSAERFLREIQIEGQLKHAHILPLFDSGDADGLLYYVMPYVAGQSLQARLVRDSQLSVSEAVRITTEVAQALSYAHGLGFVHRDVKPGNILLDEGRALLADFGIARAVTELAGDRLSDSGLVVGTPEYMSPEQGAAHGRVDGRSDIYSLGCVLYEMLSGEPPFTGPTAQAVIARHMHESARSLRVVRSTVPEHVEEAIQVALAKVPADRFSTVDEFVTALGPEGKAVSAARRTHSGRRRQLSRVGLLGAVAFVGSVGLWKIMPTQPTLDRNKVVLFPLAERGLTAADSGAGYDVAVMLSAALDHAQPLKWIDGAGLREGASQLPLSAEEMSRVARGQQAGYYIDGTVLGGAQELSVILRLHDTRGDSVVAQELANTPRGQASPVQVGLQAATKLLPALVDPGRAIDLTPLSARRPSATALWIQGEREYRRSRFRTALSFYQRAVREDSAMALAALKGAQAAGWQDLDQEAERLVDVALADPSLLSPKQQAFARGWQAYLLGNADSAVEWLGRAVALDTEWAEGHMALGEVYYHRLPTVAFPLDSLAQAEFSTAARYDSGFAPPLYHLAEIAIRQGRPEEGGALLERFKRFDPDSSRWHQLALMQSCVEHGPAAVNWEGEAATNPADLLQAARRLAVAGAQNECAEPGFRALLANADQLELHWGAFLGLHGVMMSQKRYDEIASLIDSAAAMGMVQAPALYFVDVLAGAPLDSQAEATAAVWRKKYGDQYQEISLQSRWLLAAWHAHERDTLRLQPLRAALLGEGSQAASLHLEGVLDGHLALARSDTATAVRSFRTLRVNVPAEVLEWGLVEPLALERLVMAEFAFSQGEFDKADRLAGVFDHPAPVAYLAFVPAALSIRLRAAKRAGRADLVKGYESRLEHLQDGSRIASAF